MLLRSFILLQDAWDTGESRLPSSVSLSCSAQPPWLRKHKTGNPPHIRLWERSSPPPRALCPLFVFAIAVVFFIYISWFPSSRLNTAYHDNGLWVRHPLRPWQGHHWAGGRFIQWAQPCWVVKLLFWVWGSGVGGWGVEVVDEPSSG